MTITDFLLARIREDEKAADRQGSIRAGLRLMRECSAKLAIIEAHPNGNAAYPDSPSLPPYCETCEENHDAAPWPCPTLKALAAVYADHPDYLPEWAL